MAKFEIERTEAIPFREQDWTIMQMKQYEVTVKVSQENDESLEEIEKQLDIVFERNITKTLGNDPIYQKQKRQLNFLVEKLKIAAPTKAKEIILAAKKL